MRLSCLWLSPSTRASATLQKSVIDLALRSFIRFIPDWEDDDKMSSVGVTPLTETMPSSITLSICCFSPNNTHFARKEWQQKFFASGPDFLLKHVQITNTNDLTTENSPCRSVMQALVLYIGLHPTMSKLFLRLLDSIGEKIRWMKIITASASIWHEIYTLV